MLSSGPGSSDLKGPDRLSDGSEYGDGQRERNVYDEANVGNPGAAGRSDDDIDGLCFIELACRRPWAAIVADDDDVADRHDNHRHRCRGGCRDQYDECRRWSLSRSAIGSALVDREFASTGSDRWSVGGSGQQPGHAELRSEQPAGRFLG